MWIYDGRKIGLSLQGNAEKTESLYWNGWIKHLPFHCLKVIAYCFRQMRFRRRSPISTFPILPIYVGRRKSDKLLRVLGANRKEARYLLSLVFHDDINEMETFSALLALCAGNSPVIGEFPAHRPVTRSFNVFFDLRLNKCLSKHSRRWWFETQSCSLWRHSNEINKVSTISTTQILHN